MSEKDNLVVAINELNSGKQTKFTDGAGGATNTGFISSVTQTGGAVTAGTTAFDEVVDSTTSDHTNTAPTTKAVYEAIQGVSEDIQIYGDGTDIKIDENNKINATYESLDYDNLTDTAQNANNLSNGYSIVSVKQVNGKLELGAKKYIDSFDEYSANETQAPMTKTVYNALQGKQDVITDGEDKTAAAGFIYEVKQDDGTVTSQIRDFDATITENTNTAPTSKAVHDALELKQNAFADGTGGSTTNGFISSVTQSGAAVNAGTTAFDEVVDSTTSDHANTAPTTKAVYSAIEAVSNQTDRLDLNAVGGDGKFVKVVSQANGQVSATATDFDTEVSEAGTDNTAPTTKAVYNAIQTVSQQIPDMPDACSANGVTCVLTSEGGNFVWAVLTQPVGASESGLDAQARDLPTQLYTVVNQ